MKRNQLSQSRHRMVLATLRMTASLAGAAVTAHSAQIIWGPATDTTGKANLIEGDVVLAVSGGTGATITGGGAGGTSTYTFTGVSYEDLDFTPAPGLRTTPDISNGEPGTGDANFDAIIKSFTDSRVGITGGTQTIGGLTGGTGYQVQVFFNDQRPATFSRIMTYGDGADTPHNIAIAAAGNGWGQFAVGTFTADGAVQSLTHMANGFANVHFNAILVTRPGPPPYPDVPAGLTATAGDTKVILEWDENSQYGFANFIVRRATVKGGPYREIATPTASTYTDTGLTNGVPYCYVVAARNILGQVSADTGEVTATPEVFVPPPPDIPANLNATPGNNRIILNWDDNRQPGFKEFRIKRSTTQGGPYTQVGSTADSVFADTTAINGTTFYYVVTAVNSDDVESAPSVEKAATPSPSSAPPNFLFIITDDQDTYTIGAYRRTEPAEPDASGSPYVVDTPNMDRLAAEGMLFHQARLMGANSGAVCTPSRTCIMTGKNSWQRTQGVSAAVTFPGIFNRGERSGLSALPYATYRTCKSGNSYPTANAEFTVVNDATKRGNTDGNGSEWHADHGIDYINHWQANHRPNGKPFLIYLGFSHPHDTRLAREAPDLAGRYGCINTSSPGSLVLDPDAPPLPFNHLSCTPATYPAHPFDHGHLNVRDEQTVSGIDEYRTEAVVRNEIGRNFATVDWIDRQVGRVLARLEDPDGDGDNSDSILENTYIVFTSDHGIAIGRHGLQGKQNLYEHTWRVPYIVRGPGVNPGSETDALIYLHDTFPTFCDLAGIDPPATIDGNDGRSFRAVLEGSATTHRNSLYGLYAGGDKPGIRAVTDGRFKLIKYDVNDNATQVTQLFDLQANPFELLPEHGVTNLATQPAYARVRQRLEETLMQQRIENADPYAFLGDRTLLRFEDGAAGHPATTLADRFPFGNHGTAQSGNGGALPAFSSDVPAATDFVTGATNTRSLDFEQDEQNYVHVPDARELNFGNAPFTIEAWVKLEGLPTADDFPSTMPVAQKKVIGEGDGMLDYMFLAAAGRYGDATTCSNLALHLGSTIIVSSLSIPDTRWHHISVALDPVSDSVRFTLDAQTNRLSTTASGTTNDGPLVIGAHVNSSGTIDSAFDGLIDELSITDGFLALSELQPLTAIAPAAPFQLLGVHLHPETATLGLTFESNNTRLYHIQKSAGLVAGEWSDVRTFIPGAPGLEQTTVADLPLEPDTPRQFYRVTTPD